MTDGGTANPDTTARLISQVEALEVVARRNVSNHLRGDYQSAVRGRGLIFHESRKYVPGEPAKSIDWNITARVGEPHVRVHEEERQRNIVLVVDTSPSMHAGFTRRTKLESAIELAATLAVSAVEAGDRLGYVLFADRVLERAHPRAGKAQLFRTLRALVNHTAPWTRSVPESDPRVAIHELEAGFRGPLVIFLVSDFIDHDLPQDLRYLRPRHDVTLLRIFDPFEMAAAPELVLLGASPEGEELRALLSPGEDRLHSRSRDGGQGDHDARLRLECGERRLGYLPVATDESIGTALRRLFHERRRMRR